MTLFKRKIKVNWTAAGVILTLVLAVGGTWTAVCYKDGSNDEAIRGNTRAIMILDGRLTQEMAYVRGRTDEIFKVTSHNNAMMQLHMGLDPYGHTPLTYLEGDYDEIYVDDNGFNATDYDCDDIPGLRWPWWSGPIR